MSSLQFWVTAAEKMKAWVCEKKMVSLLKRREWQQLPGAGRRENEGVNGASLLFSIEGSRRSARLKGEETENQNPLQPGVFHQGLGLLG